jgi:hypothetical protein
MTASDDDLERAIAMSLVDIEAANPCSQNDVVDLTTEDENEDDDELQRALALSLQYKPPPPTLPSSHLEEFGASLPKCGPVVARESEASTQAESTTTPAIAPSTRPFGIAGIDRKAMEQARLARLSKRKRSVSPERPSKVIAKTPSESTSSTGANIIVGPNPITSLQYPRGVIKRTWAHKHPRSHDITIEEMLQASGLKMAILSSFQWDTKWVLSKINPNRIKQIWFMNAKEAWLRKKLLDELEESEIKNLKPHFPPMDGQISNMHSKLMLLVHDDYLRVVVPTANMINVDWGETNTDAKGLSWQPAVMENTVFLIDLPRRPDGLPVEKAETAFGKELVNFLRAQDAPSNVVNGVLKFEFSETEHLAFVHSM